MRRHTVIVGRNNAGKSTAIEAINLVSLITSRYQNLSYSQPPPGSGVPLFYRVVAPSLDNFDLSFEGLFHKLDDPPAQVKAEFETGESVEIFLTAHGRLYATISGADGLRVNSKSEALKVTLPALHILPQVRPLALSEEVLGYDYVRKHLRSNLSSQHFRNQLNLLPTEFQDFRQLVEKTWPGLRIIELAGARGLPKARLGLLVDDGDGFVGEVAWMGHGLQVWLQAMWFLSRTPSSATVILDEPDVYLHPDLQRRLVRMFRDKYRQSIVATHSVEIMSEADPHDILVIERSQSQSHFADNQPAVQRLAEHIGSSYNVNLSRLWTARKLLLIEGDDLSYFGHFHSLMFPYSSTPMVSVPHVPIGGWGMWNYVMGGSRLTLQNFVGDQVTVYCVFDSDYHTPHQIAERYGQAKERGIELHVWSKKEIENYLLSPITVSRLIAKRLNDSSSAPTPEQVEDAIDHIADELKDEIISAYGTEFYADDKPGGFPKALKESRRLANGAWKTGETRWAILSGKEVLSRLSTWTQTEFGVSFGPNALLKEMKLDEVPREMKDLVKGIEAGKSILSLRTKYSL